MKIVDKVKDPLKTFKGRTLYKIEETYEDGSVYHGYYVENSSETSKRGQAYRHVTVNGKEAIVHDEFAYQKAEKILLRGFPF